MLPTFISAACWAQEAFGTWKMNPSRSSLGPDSHAREITLRIERHAKGEVFTVDRILANGRAATSSMILYLNGQPRAFQGETCSGTQSSQRLDERTVEVRFQCQNGRSVLMVRRISAEARILILEISDQLPGSRRLQCRLVLEKQ
jgi:hypothetical protein